MDIQEIKDLWNYFYLYDNKRHQRSIEKKKKKEKGEYFLQPCSLGKSRQTEQGSFLYAFYFPVVFEIPLLAWQIMSLGNKSIRTDQVWDKRKLFCKQHVLLPACAYFLSHDYTDKTSLVVSETLLWQTYQLRIWRVVSCGRDRPFPCHQKIYFSFVFPCTWGNLAELGSCADEMSRLQEGAWCR